MISRGEVAIAGAIVGVVALIAFGVVHPEATSILRLGARYLSQILSRPPMPVTIIGTSGLAPIPAGTAILSIVAASCTADGSTWPPRYDGMCWMDDKPKVAP